MVNARSTLHKKSGCKGETHTRLRGVRMMPSISKPIEDPTVDVSFQFKEAGSRLHRLKEVVGRVKARERRPPFERCVRRGHAHPFARCPRAVQLKPY